MIIISHRGNLNGSNPFTENSIPAINIALNNGFDVEIDVWFKNNKWYLGHDKPIYSIKESFLQNNKLWCHAKNLDALSLMLKNKKIHCFWHQNDDFTLTSKNYIWTYPNKEIRNNSILVLTKKQKITKNIFGICTDFPLLYINKKYGK
jgi:glycerophosphoryl diester phosphodiesterase